MWAAKGDGTIDWEKYNKQFPPADVTPQQRAKLMLLDAHAAVHPGTGKVFLIRIRDNRIPADRLMQRSSLINGAFDFDTVDEAIKAATDRKNYTWR